MVFRSSFYIHLKACPQSMQPHIQQIVEGEYDVMINLDKPTILDIGANIGGFAAWAIRRWPGSVVHCYEPSASNRTMLEANIAGLVHSHPYAVGDTKHTKLYRGKNNCGESSVFMGREQLPDYEEIVTVSPLDLPKGEILKIDTEGCELEILEPLIKDKRMFHAIMVEYHSDYARRAIDSLLVDYFMVNCSAYNQERGLVKYIHNQYRGIQPG